MAQRIHQCRVCKGPLLELWELGEFALCGTFPSPGEEVPKEPMGLSWCVSCDLTQMHYQYDQALYGEGYGYRSGINPAMVSHLHRLARYGQIAADLWLGDVVLDIGGNDGTLLAYFGDDVKRLLIDPTAGKWPPHPGIRTLAERFSYQNFCKLSPDRKAQLVFTVAMFYDLEDPSRFARDVSRCLSSDGVWILEQSYLPEMVRQNAFDTICHEHLEYYTLPALTAILSKAARFTHEVEFNDTNGGSILLSVRGNPPRKPVQNPDLEWHAPTEITAMRYRVDAMRAQLHYMLASAGKVVGWGASTKGNTLLQHWGITREQMPCIVDVNPEKWGKVTPGTGIPIVERAEADAYLVLPWHFRSFVIEREQEFLRHGGRLIFPLPEPEVVTWATLSGRG